MLFISGEQALTNPLTWPDSFASIIFELLWYAEVLYDGCWDTVILGKYSWVELQIVETPKKRK